MEIQFDPGFVKHMSAFVPNIQYVYNSLAQFKNFNQRKLQFKMYFPKIQNLVKNYIGFYLGCMLWAVYIKQFENEDILNNLCYGGEYSDEETLFEVDFIKEYFEQLKKDAKYYIGQEYSYDEIYIKIIDAYKEFLKANEGFVKTQKTNDLKIPDIMKTPSKEDLEIISKEINIVVNDGNLYNLLKLTDKVL